MRNNYFNHFGVSLSILSMHTPSAALLRAQEDESSPNRMHQAHFPTLSFGEHCLSFPLAPGTSWGQPI